MEKNKIEDREYNEQTITQDFSRVTKIYDYWAGLTEKKAQQQVLDYAEISDGIAILEVAVGTGMLFKKMVEQNPTGRNIGLDISVDMLGKAKGRMAQSNLENYQLEVGNALELPFENSQFDLLVNNFMLDLLPQEDFQPILEEFYRVLNPGGRVVISSMSFGTKKIHQFWSWLARNFPRLLTGCRPISIQETLKDVGFKEIRVSELSQNTFPSEVTTGLKP